ncbi:MAG: alpha-2-macroglobulin family protein [Pseudomonadota bacterium]
MTTTLQLGALALLAIFKAGAALAAPAVNSFGPTGMVRAVKQIHLSFNEQVLAMGDAKGPAPAMVQCSGGTAAPAGRWLDGRRWVAEFANELPDGVSCTVTPQAIQSQTGASVALAPGWKFNTGGPRLLYALPNDGEVRELPFSAFFLSAKVEPGTLGHLHCAVNGRELPVSILDDAQASAYAGRLVSDSATHNPHVYARCGTLPWPNDAAVSWTWGKRIAAIGGLENAQDEHVERRVRSAFTAALSCAEQLGTPGCDTRHPIELEFSAPLGADRVQGIVLRDAKGKTFTPSYAPPHAYQRGVSLRFSVADAAGAALRLELPSTVRDIDGRDLEGTAPLSAAIALAHLPPYVGMESGDAILEWQTGSTVNWPVAARGEVGTIKARAWRFGAETPSPVILALHADSASDTPGATMPIATRPFERSDARLAALHAPLPQPLERELTAPSTAANMVALPLAQFGNWLVEADSPAYRAALRAQRAQLERRQQEKPAHTIVIRGGLIEWDGRRLRNNAALEREMAALAASPAGKGAMLQIDAHSHEDEEQEMLFDLAAKFGLRIESAADLAKARSAQALQWKNSRSALVQLTNLNLHTIVSQHGDSLVWVTALDSGTALADVSVEIWTGAAAPFRQIASLKTDVQGRAVLSHDALADPRGNMPSESVWVLARRGADLAVARADSANNYTYRNDQVTHTVLDRVLFHPGETVSMAHELRVPDRAGWVLAGLQDLRVQISRADNDDVIAEQALLWADDGSAASSWPIPPEARLGEYRYRLHGRNGMSYGEGHFQIEQFRLPAFDASLALASSWREARQTISIAPALAFLAGGAAAGQALSIDGKYAVGAPAPVPGYSFIDLELERHAAFSFPKTTLKLDKSGRARVEIAPPVTALPLTLTAEMQFADASGETHTHSTNLALWPQRHKLGLRVERAPDGATLNLSMLALDENNGPVAGRKLTIDAAEFSTDWGRIHPIADSSRFAVCTASSGPDGKAQCSLPWTRTSTLAGWLFRVRANAMASASAVLYRQAEHAVQPMIETLGSAAPSTGEPLRLRLRAPFLPATVLVSLEREGVLASQTYTLTRAEEDITLPSAPNFAPGLSVNATFVQGSKHLPAQLAPGTDAHKMLERSARITLMFNPASKRLQVDVKPASATARPGTALPVRITVRRESDATPAAGAHLTLIAVDDALELLKPNATTALLERFWFDRGHDTTQAALAAQWLHHPHIGPLSDFQPKLELAIATQGAPADQHKRFLSGMLSRRRPIVYSEMVASAPYTPRSDNVALASSEFSFAPVSAPRMNFSTLALWQAHVTLDSAGQAQVDIPLPDTLTRWRIVAVASAGTDLFGKGEATIETSKPFQILPGLPLSVRGGDLLEQQITVRNTSKAAARLSLRARASVLAHPDLAPSQTSADAPRVPEFNVTLALDAGAARVLALPLRVPDNTVALDWNITLTDSADGSVADAVALRQAVVLRAPLTVRESTLLAVPGSQSLSIARPPDTPAGIGAVLVRWQASLAGAAIEGARAWARTYPHACFEQRSSVAAILGERAAWDATMADLPRHLENGLVRFYPETPGNEDLTAYLLTLAKMYDLPLPRQEMETMRDALRTRLARAPDKPDDAGETAVRDQRLAWQAAVGEVPGWPASLIPADLNALPTEALLDWISYVLDAPGLPERAVQLRQAASQLRQRYEMHGAHIVWRAADGLNSSAMRPRDGLAARTALLLQRWQAIEPIWTDELVLLPQALGDAIAHPHANTTVGNAYKVAALQRFAASIERGTVAGVSTATLEGVSRANTWPAHASQSLPLPPTQGATLHLAHSGTGAPWANVALLAAVKPLQPVAHGLTLTKNISAVERRVPGRWSVGDVLKVTLTMRSDSDLAWLALSDPIPSGATILGKGLAREGKLVQEKENLPGWWRPSVIERASDALRGYYERTWAGQWQTEYLLRLNNAGSFGLPASRIEAMYAPEIYGEAPNTALEVSP